MSDNKRWCMDFSNYEIRKYLINKLKKGTDVLYMRENLMINLTNRF